MPFRLLAVLLLTGLTACSASEPEPPTALELDADALRAVSLTPGIHDLEVPVGNVGVFRYTLSVPDVPPGELVPFVVALHWAGNIGPYFANTSGYLPNLVQPALDELDALIFAPEVPGASWQDPLSEALVMAFLDLALETWPIDPERVVVTGYSMGGFGTWYLTDVYPDRFSAGIPMASFPVGRMDRPVPLYVIHGAQDELFSSSALEQNLLQLQAQGQPVEWVIVDTLSHYEGFQYVDVLRGAVPWLRDSVWVAPR